MISLKFDMFHFADLSIFVNYSGWMIDLNVSDQAYA